MLDLQAYAPSEDEENHEDDECLPEILQLQSQIVASIRSMKDTLSEAEAVIKETLIKQGKDGPTLVLYSELLWDMGKFEQALDLRIEAHALFRKAGNTIMAEEVLAWMNVEAIPTLKKIEKPKSPPVEQIEIEPVTAPAPVPSAPLSPTIVEDKSPGLQGPGRRAFSPKAKPEPIMIDDDLPVITGSGVILNDGYWVLTNKHVVEDLEYAVVRNGLGEVRDAEEVFMAEEDDLAIIVLAEPFAKAYSFETSEFENAEVGSDVFVLGYPMSAIFGSFHPTITRGIVSNPYGFAEQQGEFQMTTKINPGNSGGPIFNEYGKIVGVATARLDKAEEGRVVVEVHMLFATFDVIGKALPAADRCLVEDGSTVAPRRSTHLNSSHDGFVGPVHSLREAAIGISDPQDHAQPPRGLAGLASLVR